ncbi:MAG TPA: YHS domain-containing protein, partial [Caulobacteraceae bacterium]
MTDHHHHHHDGCDHETDGKTATDPVCGMKVDPHKTQHRTTHEGHPFYFCSASCKTKFEVDPEKYLADREAPPPAPPGTIYTCPMHPEIRQEGPGSCPICGMALEPETVTADTGPNPELADMTRRFWIGLVVTLPLLVLEMGGHVGLALPVPHTVMPWLQLALAAPVVLWAGAPFFARGWASLKTRNLNMFTLIAMGTGTAFAYSLIGVLAPGIFPPAFRDAHGQVPLYFEAAAMITVLVLLGQVLEL